MRWQSGVTDAGEVFAIDDPMSDRLEKAIRDAGTTQERVDGLFGLLSFRPDPELRTLVVAKLAALESSGAMTAIDGLRRA